MWFSWFSQCAIIQWGIIISYFSPQNFTDSLNWITSNYIFNTNNQCWFKGQYHSSRDSDGVLRNSWGVYRALYTANMLNLMVEQWWPTGRQGHITKQSFYTITRHFCDSGSQVTRYSQHHQRQFLQAVGFDCIINFHYLHSTFIPLPGCTNVSVALLFPPIV